MSEIKIEKISITKIGCKCIVNAANEHLFPGSGVCGYIFSAAGYNKLVEACTTLGSYCPTGQAVITPGFNLCEYIIHAVGPVYKDGQHNEPKLLYGAYKSSLVLAKENNIHSIGFPLISAGIFGYPVKQAWQKAIEACNDFIKENPDYNIEIKFAVIDDKVLETGLDVLKDNNK